MSWIIAGVLNLLTWPATLCSQTNVCFLSPDVGGIKRVELLADLFGAKTAFTKKKRISYDEILTLDLEGDVKDKIVIMIDDIVDTGKTAARAAEMVMTHGAKKVFGCFCHAVFSAGAVELLQNSPIEKIWVSNTLLSDRTFGSKITEIDSDRVIVEYLTNK